MQKVTHIVGIDPGLVHTGLVSMLFVPTDRHLTIQHNAAVGAKADEVDDWIRQQTYGPKPTIFIEDYRTRGSFNTDDRMRKAVAEIKAATNGTALDNMGVKGVVKRPLMELLGVWKFPTPTHHQDLRSAARIALFGMLKDPELNAIVTAVVKAHLDGRPWTVHHS